MELRGRFQQAIDDAKFDMFHLDAFRQDPKLALEMGMSMGYTIAIEDIEKMIDKKFNLTNNNGVK